MKVVVVGERANRDGPYPLPFPLEWARVSPSEGAFSDERSRSRLSSLGVRWEEADSLNLMPPSRDRSWCRRYASEVADLLLPSLRGRLVLACGRRPVAAFGVKESRWGDATTVGGVRVVLLPHPSGLNRFWNDPADVDRLASRLRVLLRKEARRAEDR